MTKLKNSNCDKTQKLKLWPNLRTQMATKLKKSICDKTQILKLWQNSKSQIVTKLKNSNCDKTQKLKLWQLKNSNCDKTQKLKLWPNSKTPNCEKINSNCDKNLKLKLWQNLTVVIVKILVKTTLTHWQPIHIDNRWDVQRAAFCDSRNVFSLVYS